MKFWHKNGSRYNINLKKILVGISIICVGIIKMSINVNAQDELSVLELYKNSQSTKYKLEISEDIYKITDMNGIEIIPERVYKNDILFENNGNNTVRVFTNELNYIDVNLENAVMVTDTTPPNILWKYKNTEDNTIYLEIQDSAGLYEMRNVRQAEALRAIFTRMQKDVVLSLSEKDINNKIEIFDVFGNKAELDISDITLDVNIATRDMLGTKIALKLRDTQNNISNVTYLDGVEIAQIGSSEVENVYAISEGTTKVIVNHGTENTVVQLDTDMRAPEVVRIWKNEDSSIIMLETRDLQSGVDKITVCNGDEEILRNVNGLIKRQILSEEIEDGITYIGVYDTMGNKIKIPLDDVLVDTLVPQITLKYENGEYRIITKEINSGVIEIKLDNTQIERYEDCPTSEIVYILNDLDGESYVKVCNGVGNEAILKVNDGLSTCVRAYKNNAGTAISIDVSDQRGIVKITDQADNVIERFFTNVKDVSTTYSTRKNTEGIKIYYQDDKCYTISLTKLTTAPIVSDEVFDDYGYVKECKVFSPAGIKQIVYSTGKKEVFKKGLLNEMVVNCMDENDDDELEPVYVKVYDGVGNIVKINEDLL